MTVYFHIIDEDEEVGDFKFKINDVRTYYSTEPTDVFSSIYWSDGNLHSITQVTQDITLQNSYPSLILDSSLHQSNLEPEALSNYTFRFKPAKQLPGGARIVLSWPETVVLNSTEIC